ncbi:MAG: FecR domain-containing protein [Sphingopyxis sp.]|uniref:FecR family protein n=1 Tax=Sphingopyxis sp. TaxID=1908224 RepID=UPI001A27EE55|nr:FecR domain-containing protein [Sphingopyxis sp.]MBJ7499605.1 FecR domain-containing protein [Sphingopyxis sp.]
MSCAQEARDRAALWVVAREQDDWSESDQAALDAWLAESDMNKAAYWRLDHSWREADRIGALGRNESRRQEPSPRGRWWVPAALAASLTLVAGAGFYRSWQADQRQSIAQVRYDTPVGGHRKVGLPDGSRIELNTASAVRAAVGKAKREIWLDRGEAYFEVAHKEGRPFVVHAGSRTVTVLGTKFSVRRDGGKVIVSVLEGRVRVDDVANVHAVRSTIISGGDIALARGAATLVTARSDTRVEDALAWRAGMLSFDQSRLADVAAEFNRYNEKQMVVTDSTVSNIRIGGMFPAAKPDDFVRLLRDAYGLRVEETGREMKISS